MGLGNWSIRVVSRFEPNPARGLPCQAGGSHAIQIVGAASDVTVLGFGSGLDMWEFPKKGGPNKVP